MKIVLAILLLLTLFAYWLVFMNSASEKIVTAVIPITVGALTAVFLSVFVFGAQPAISDVFPAAYTFRKDNNTPWIAPRPLAAYSYVMLFPTSIYKSSPEIFGAWEGTRAVTPSTIYHHLLQRVMIDWMMFHYRADWQIEILQLERSVGREERIGPQHPQEERRFVRLDASHIERVLQGNLFAGHSALAPEMAGLSLPPNTEISVTAPRSTEGGLETGVILMRNGLCTIHIETQQSGGMIGAGRYGAIAGLSEQENGELWTVQFIVRTRIEFSRWFSGHSKMPEYRAWAAQVVERLKAQFSEEVLWERTKEEVLFAR